MLLFARKGDLLRSYQLGANAYVVKTGGLHDFVGVLNAVKKILAQHQRTAAEGKTPALRQTQLRSR